MTRRVRLPTTIGLCVLAVCLAACRKLGDSPTIQNTSDPQWIERHQPNAPIAVVFVHGIFGDTLGTWTAPATSFFKLLKEDPEIGPKVDIFAFGYTSKMLISGSLAIDEAANLLYARLDNEGVLKYPSIVFINHSMGGLVTMRMLLQRADVRAKTPVMVLFGTPTEGAQITTIASRIAHNPALVDMLPAESNTFLRSLDDDFKALTDRPRIACGYEKIPAAGIIVVPWSSASRVCDSTLAIAANHIDIVKPDRPQHDSFLVVRRALHPLVTPCRNESHGIEHYNQTIHVTRSSNWMSGGSSQQPWCDALINALRTEYPGGVFTQIGSSERSRSRCRPFNCPEYKYTCTVQIQTDPVYKEAISNACVKRQESVTAPVSQGTSVASTKLAS